MPQGSAWEQTSIVFCKYVCIKRIFKLSFETVHGNMNRIQPNTGQTTSPPHLPHPPLLPECRYFSDIQGENLLPHPKSPLTIRPSPLGGRGKRIVGRTEAIRLQPSSPSMLVLDLQGKTYFFQQNLFSKPPFFFHPNDIFPPVLLAQSWYAVALCRLECGTCSRESFSVSEVLRSNQTIP